MGNVFYFNWEFDVLCWFQSIRNDVLDFIFPKISFLGNSGWFWIVVGILVFIFAKDKRFSWNMIFGLLLSAIIVNLLLKPSFNRARPCDVWEGMFDLLVKRPSDSSFPSGHTNFSFAGATIIFLWNKKIGIPALVLAALIAISRLYLFMHFPTDVLVGMATGIISAIVTFIFVKWLYEKNGKTVDTYKFF